MTREEARRLAIEANDRDHAAGKLPSRYIEDERVLTLAARLLDAVPDRPGRVADQGRGARGRT